MNILLTIIKKEILEDAFSGRGGILILTSSIVLSVFCLLLVGNTELSLLDNAQAVYMISGLIILVGMLISVIKGSDSLAGERDRGTLETLLITPATISDIQSAKLGEMLVSWIFLFAVSIPYLVAVGSDGQNLLSAILYTFMSGSFIVTIFFWISSSLSAIIKSFKSVLSSSLVILILSGIPVILGPSLRQAEIGKILDWLNPFAISLNMLDSVIIDSQGINHQIIPISSLIFYLLIFGIIQKKASGRTIL